MTIATQIRTCMLVTNPGPQYDVVLDYVQDEKVVFTEGVRVDASKAKTAEDVKAELRAVAERTIARLTDGETVARALEGATL